MSGAVVVVPQFGASFGIVGVNYAAGVRHEHEITPGRQHARNRRLWVANLPLLSPGHRVARVKMAVDLAARRGRHLEFGANIELDLWRDDRSRLCDVEGHAPFLADLVVEPRLRVVRTAVPANTPANIRAQRR